MESLWNMASPGAYTRPTENNQPLSTPEGQCTPKMTGTTGIFKQTKMKLNLSSDMILDSLSNLVPVWLCG